MGRKQLLPQWLFKLKVCLKIRFSKTFFFFNYEKLSYKTMFLVLHWRIHPNLLNPNEIKGISCSCHQSINNQITRGTESRVMTGRCKKDSFQFITSTSHYDLSLKCVAKGAGLTFFLALVGYFHSILTIFSISTEATSYLNHVFPYCLEKIKQE